MRRRAGTNAAARKPPPARAGRRPAAAAAVGLALGALLLYAGALPNDFVFDDEAYVLGNVNVQRGLDWPAVRWAFTSVYKSNYHPLTWLSHAVDWSLWGANPSGHRLAGVLLHAANTALLFLLFRGMTGSAGRSAVVAALFAVHPLRVESVAWVAERKDTLSTLFWLAALHAYVRYARSGRVRPYVLALVFMVLGVLSKQMVVTLPFVLLLLDFWPLGRLAPLGRSLLEKLPFVAVAAAGSAAAIVAQSRGGSLVPLDVIPLDQRVANAAVSYVRYLAKAAWPVDLAVFYPFRAVPFADAAAAAVLLAVVTAVAVRVARRHPAVTFGWVFYLVTLVPVIGLVQIGAQASADRYTYVPLIGIFAAVCWLAADLAAGRPALRSLAAPAAALLVATLSVTTVRQLETWRDEVRLYQHAISVTRDNFLAHDNLGTALVSRGRLPEAIGHYRESVRIRPRGVTYSNLGSALADLGMAREAVAAHREAVRLEPADAVHRVNLASALAADGRLEEAAAEMAEAVRLQPDNVVARTRLARLLANKGRRAEARGHLEAALRLEPSNTDALLEMGNLLVSEGRPAEARSLYEQVARADPSNAVAVANLGILLVDEGNLGPGIANLSRAVELAPSLQVARENLVRALVTEADGLAASGAYSEAAHRIDLAMAAAGNAPQVRAALEPRRAAYLGGRPFPRGPASQ
jgi:Flp pilus assembly protein TadD